MTLTLGMPGLGTAEEPTAFPKKGPQGKILPKARKAGIKLKPKGNMDPWGNVNLPGTG